MTRGREAGRCSFRLSVAEVLTGGLGDLRRHKGLSDDIEGSPLEVGVR